MQYARGWGHTGNFVVVVGLAGSSGLYPLLAAEEGGRVDHGVRAVTESGDRLCRGLLLDGHYAAARQRAHRYSAAATTTLTAIIAPGGRRCRA